MNSDLEKARDILLSRQDIGAALEILSKYSGTNLLAGLQADYENIAADYNLMKEYMLKGYRDDGRGELYARLLARLYELVNNAIVKDYTMEKSTYKTANDSIKNFNTDQSVIRTALESYVQNVAMSSLENDEETRREKLGKIYSTHHTFVCNLFCHMLTSKQWTEGNRIFHTDLLLSPTIDGNDACVLLSAISISLINVFDFNKFHTLVEVFKNATDERLRQRALTGIVFTLPKDEVNIYPALRDIVDSLLSSDTVCKELKELQLQILYCMNADNDAKKIKDDIMPTLINNSNFTVTRAGIVEREEDTLRDILHPDEEERAMEKMEESFNSMVNMQKQGADIYFGGFSQMKRFPFFYTIANWFMPFYVEHPALKDISLKLKDSKFLNFILKNGPFCDSDKYSFALSLSNIVMKIPDSMREMLDNGELATTADSAGIDTTRPAYLRRTYIQDLYRFFRLFSSKQDFRNPFDTNGGTYMFVCNDMVVNSPLSDKINDIMKLLLSHRLPRLYAEKIANAYDPHKSGDAEYLYLSAYLKLKNGEYSAAESMFEKVVEQQPDNNAALKGLAKAAFHNGNHEKALNCYDNLIAIAPDDSSLQLSKAILLVNEGDLKEGMTTLFRLNYENPADTNILRTMAWGHMRGKQPEKAVEVYMKLLDNNALPSDYLNCGYAYWFQHDIGKATDLFRQFLSTQNSKDCGLRTILAEEFATDTKLIALYEISEVDKKLIIDLAAG